MTTAIVLTAMLLASPPAEPAAIQPTPPEPGPSMGRARSLRPAQASRRLLIGGGVTLGLAFTLELTGAIISTRCQPGDWCGGGVVYAWGSAGAGTRFTLLTGGTSSAYVHGRVLAIPLVATGYGLTVRAAALRGRTSARMGDSVDPRRLWVRSWLLLGTGIGVYAASRFVRWGFGYAGVCQQAMCVHGLDLTTLGIARSLMVTGSSGLAFRRAHLNGLTVAPTISSTTQVGLTISGRF